MITTHLLGLESLSLSDTEDHGKVSIESPCMNLVSYFFLEVRWSSSIYDCFLVSYPNPHDQIADMVSCEKLQQNTSKKRIENFHDES